MGPRQGRETRLFVYRGKSMWPLFQDGDVLRIETALPSEAARRPEAAPHDLPRRGDCIAFSTDGQSDLVVHRVTGRLPEGLVTRGDAHEAVDAAPVPLAAVFGRVTARFRHGAWVRVQGGWAGRLGAVLHRAAGRLDPERPTRGGTVGRALQLVTGPIVGRVLAPALRHDEALGMVLTHGPLPERVVAVRARSRAADPGLPHAAGAGWVVTWPWRLFLTPDALARCLKRRGAAS